MKTNEPLQHIPRFPFLTKTGLLQKNSYFHGSACFSKVVGIITDFMDFYRFLVPVLAYLCLLLGSSFVHWFLAIFWCQNGSQNGPQNLPQNSAKRAQSQTPSRDPPGVDFGVVFGRFWGSFRDPFWAYFDMIFNISCKYVANMHKYAQIQTKRRKDAQNTYKCGRYSQIRADTRKYAQISNYFVGARTATHPKK